MPPQPTKSFKQASAAVRRGATAVPLIREIEADTLTPVAAFLRLARKGDPSFLLESVEGGEHTARYSFLGTRPFETLFVRDGIARWKRAGSEGRLAGETAGRLAGCPFKSLGRRIADYVSLPEAGLPPFCGGAVGHVAYEMARHLEPSAGIAPGEEDEARLMLFGNVAAFDQVRHRLILISNVLPGVSGSLRAAYARSADALDEMEMRLRRPVRPLALGSPGTPRRLSAEGSARLGAKKFLAGVRRLKRHIREGDIFQAVLSDRFEAPLHDDAFSVYRRLRRINPSPYMFFIGKDGDAALGASPEMLVRVSGREFETRPIAGTRPRGHTEEEDLRQERLLLASPKERAEHLMLVDLGRNDIGREARPGTVSVPAFENVERYSHVMHLVSSVRGKLKPGRGPWDAFAACFPAGTVSGAPKIRAMRLVSEIEAAPRGLYAGAVVYHDFHGNLDSAIAIRSLTVKGRRAFVQAGAGIVADSRPAAELKEIRAKAGATLQALAGGAP